MSFPRNISQHNSLQQQIMSCVSMNNIKFDVKSNIGNINVETKQKKIIVL